jgi:hypothetical protein
MWSDGSQADLAEEQKVYRFFAKPPSREAKVQA